jgi:hypothetical protein
MSSQIQATCPICHSTLDYGDQKFGNIGDQIYYPFKCENPQCGFEGREYYKVVYAYQTDADGNAISLSNTSEGGRK